MNGESLSKKYFRVARIVDNVDMVLIAITLGGGAGGVVNDSGSTDSLSDRKSIDLYGTTK